MSKERRAYIAIDLKSFYASVECVERGMNPLGTHLVVADASRTDKTICLAVSPSLKALGVSGRPRLFEVVRRVKEINAERLRALGGGRFGGKSWLPGELEARPDLEVDYVVAPPRMALYMEYSTRIFKTYLKYVSPEDIHVYSVDEVFIDVTSYLKPMGMTAHEIAITMIRDVLRTTGVTATAGIGTNMYLAKVAMDILAKKMAPDSDGVRIAELDEPGYRRKLWSHEPLTDFWRVGRGIARRLAPYGLTTMGDIARASLKYENLFYQLFGVNAELLIDHAWGREPCTIDMVKSYRPETHSISNGQVLTEPYTYRKALVVAMEMAEGVALKLLDNGLVTDQLTLDIDYDVDNIRDESIRAHYTGTIVMDHYGRMKPQGVHGSQKLKEPSLSAKAITEAVTAIFSRIVDPKLLIRRINISANHLVPEAAIRSKVESVQLDLFTDYDQQRLATEKRTKERAKERRLMETALSLKKRFGKNALLKGLDYQEGATARERNKQIGGHKA